MARIVGPDLVSAPEAATPASVEAEATEESGVNKQTATEPSAAPAPTAPATPTGKQAADKDSRIEAKSVTVQARVIQVGIRPPIRSTPDVIRVIVGNIHSVRIGRLDLNRALTALIGIGHDLLRPAPQPAVGLGTRTHSLHGGHYIRLLAQKGISQIGRPTNVAAQQPERIGKGHQGLDAGIPILLASRIHQLLSLKSAVLLKPLLGFGNLERVGARRQHLAEEGIGIESNRGHQIIQLLRRQHWPGRRRCLGWILRKRRRLSWILREPHGERK